MRLIASIVLLAALVSLPGAVAGHACDSATVIDHAAIGSVELHGSAWFAAHIEGMDHGATFRLASDAADLHIWPPRCPGRSDQPLCSSVGRVLDRCTLFGHFPHTVLIEVRHAGTSGSAAPSALIQDPGPLSPARCNASSSSPLAVGRSGSLTCGGLRGFSPWRSC